MAAQFAAFRQRRVIEVFARVDHADALHHRPRRQVDKAGERDDFRQPEPLETHAQRGARGLGGVTVAPERPRQPPAHFHARHERQLRAARHGQADEADELARSHPLHRPIAPATLGEFGPPHVDAAVARLAADHAGEIPHHRRVSIQRGERRAVGVAPLAQAQARRRDLDGFNHGRRRRHAPARSASCWRSTRRRILPAAVFGIASHSTTSPSCL